MRLPSRAVDFAGAVVGGGDFDHIDADHGRFQGDPPHGVQQLAGGEAARFGCAGAGRHAGIDDIDIDGEEDAVAVVGDQRESFGQAGLHAALDDFGHFEPAHLLVMHPLQNGRVGPIAAQADLDEAVAPHCARQDQAAHGGAVSPRGRRRSRRCRRGRRSGISAIRPMPSALATPLAVA